MQFINNTSFYNIEERQIVYLKVDGRQCKLFMTNGTSLMTSISLKKWETNLSQEDFLRVNHSMLINLKEIVKYDKVKGILWLSNGNTIEVSRRRRKKLWDALIHQSKNAM